MLENSPRITPSSSLSGKVGVEKSKGMLCFEEKVWPLYFDVRAPYIASHYEAAAGRLLGRIWVFPFIDLCSVVSNEIECRMRNGPLAVPHFEGTMKSLGSFSVKLMRLRQRQYTLLHQRPACDWQLLTRWQLPTRESAAARGPPLASH
jgi:hypothetical protein